QRPRLLAQRPRPAGGSRGGHRSASRGQSAGSGRNRTRTAPSPADAPTATQRRSTGGRTSRRSWSPTVTTSSSPDRASLTSDLRTYGNGTVSSYPGPTGETAGSSAGGPGASGSSGPYTASPSASSAAGS